MPKTITSKKTTPVKFYITEPTFVLKGSSPRYEFKDGVRTNNILGYKYEVVSTQTFDTLVIFVPQDKVLITNEELTEKQEQGEVVIVEFKNAELKVFYNTFTKAIEDSIRAEAINFVENLIEK